MTPAWEQLSCRLHDQASHPRLSRFFRCVSASDIAPDAVTATSFEAFHASLGATSLRTSPGTVYRNAAIAWNHAQADVPGWPTQTIPVPSFSRRYALDWADFPASSGIDCQAFLHHSGNQDPFADDFAASVKPSTTIMRRKQILQLATALVNADVPASTITSLSVLTDPANAAKALNYIWMAAFDDPANVAALLSLPGNIFAELDRKATIHRQDALRAMIALAVEILLVVPMRLGNVVALGELGHRLHPRATELGLDCLSGFWSRRRERGCG